MSVGNGVCVSVGREAFVGAVVAEGAGVSDEIRVGNSVATGLVQEVMKERKKEQERRTRVVWGRCMEVF